MFPVGVTLVLVVLQWAFDALVRRARAGAPSSTLVRNAARTLLIPVALVFAVSAWVTVDRATARRREADAAVAEMLHHALPDDAILAADHPEVLAATLGRTVRSRGSRGELPAGATPLVVRRGPAAGRDVDGIAPTALVGAREIGSWAYPPATADRPPGPLQITAYALPLTPR